MLSAAFSPDGKRIVTASADKHGAAVGRRDRQADRRAAQRPCGVVCERGVQPRRQAHRHRVFGQDGAAVGRRRPASRSASRSTGHEDAVSGARRSAPTASASSPRLADKTARLWDAATGKPIGEPLKGHEDGVMSAAFSPDGKRIVTASVDKTARLWDAATGKPIGEPLKGHDGLLCTSAAFSPDGKRIVTASRGQDGAAVGRRDRQAARRTAHEAMRVGVRARRSAPTASASSPRLATRRRGCGTPRPASRSASRSRAMTARC